MSDTKWTKGPWHVSDVGAGFEVDDALGNCVLQAQQVKPIAHDLTQQERKANARLCAAATELYEALEMAFKQGTVNQPPWVALAKKALAKARGESL